MNPSKPNLIPPNGKVLSELKLSPDELAALKANGTIVQERRRNSVIYRLRFRTPDGRQQSRYLGTDQNRVQQADKELRELQHRRQTMRELKRLSDLTRRRIREHKHHLSGELHSQGYHWHGLQPRRRASERHPA